MTYAKSDLTIEPRSMKFIVKGFADEDRTLFDMDELYTGRNIELEVTLKNISADNVSLVNTGFYVDDKFIGQVRLRFLPGRASKAVSVIWIPKEPGKYIIKAVIDYENQIDEDDEMNNILEKEITITEGKLPMWYPVTKETGVTVIINTEPDDDGADVEDE